MATEEISMDQVTSWRMHSFRVTVVVEMPILMMTKIGRPKKAKVNKLNSFSYFCNNFYTMQYLLKDNNSLIVKNREENSKFMRRF